MSKALDVTGRVNRVLKEVSGCRSMYGLEQNDMTFLHGLCARQQTLSERQERWLSDIEEKVFGENEEDDELA